MGLKGEVVPVVVALVSRACARIAAYLGNRDVRTSMYSLGATTNLYIPARSLVQCVNAHCERPRCARQTVVGLLPGPDQGRPTSSLTSMGGSLLLDGRGKRRQRRRVKAFFDDEAADDESA